MNIAITIKQYFSVVGLITLIGSVYLIWKSPENKQYIKEALGLTKPLKETEDSFYNQRVDVVFEKYCTGCHDDNKDKGDLRLDSFKHTVFGGKNGNMLSGGAQSLLFQRMSLPEDSRLAMPPYGRDRQTAEEMTLIKLWLNKGASGILTEADFPNAPIKVKDIIFDKINWDTIKLSRQPLIENVQSLQKRYPGNLVYIARVSKYLELNNNGLRHLFDDETLAKFQPLFQLITILNLKGSSISDASIGSINQMKNLKTINLSGTKISTKGLQKLSENSHLKRIIVDRSLTNNAIKTQFDSLKINVTWVSK